MMSTPEKLAYLSLPKVGIGTGLWYMREDPNSREHAIELAQHVVGEDKPFFDTAARYGGGWSEEVLGEALAEIPRERYMLATKAGFRAREGSGDADALRRQLFTIVEASLKRLRVDYVDILHLHDPDCCLMDAVEIAFPALMELKEQGLARAIGSGMNQWEMLSEFAQRVDVDCFLLAGRYTLIEQGGLPLLDMCQQKGIAIFLGGVYNTGILATGAKPGAMYNYRPATPAILEKVRHLEQVCERYGIPLRASAVQFPFGHPAVRTLILGVRTVAEYQEAREAMETPIPAQFWDDLRAEGLLTGDAPSPR